VDEKGDWEPCSGTPESLKLVFSHNIEIGRQKPLKGQYLGAPQQPKQESADPTTVAMANRKYESMKFRLTGIYVPAP
jgi:hypothetical protein